MKIELITKDEYKKLLDIYNENPVFSLQNKGYEGIDKTKFTEIEAGKFKEVAGILKKSIAGFSSFQNFRLSKKENKIQLRFQYNYGHDEGHYFVGVGYILLDELLNGFKN